METIIPKKKKKKKKRKRKRKRKRKGINEVKYRKQQMHSKIEVTVEDSGKG
jgi:hypothetical protein